MKSININHAVKFVVLFGSILAIAGAYYAHIVNH